MSRLHINQCLSKNQEIRLLFLNSNKSHVDLRVVLLLMNKEMLGLGEEAILDSKM